MSNNVHISVLVDALQSGLMFSALVSWAQFPNLFMNTLNETNMSYFDSIFWYA